VSRSLFVQGTDWGAAAESLKVPIRYLARTETVETISLLDQPADTEQ
jgi:hypothetical protein